MTAGAQAASRQTIYLAGFDVFRIDAVDYGRSLQQLCQTFGFEGLFPLDAAAPPDLTRAEHAAWISRANQAAIRSADMVMANLADFRGVGEPDSGTAFEVGFAAALGKDIWAYRDHDVPLLRHVPSTSTPAGQVCERGYLVEDFGLQVNLMLACSARIITGGPRACLSAIAQAYGVESTPSLYRLESESKIRVGAG